MCRTRIGLWPILDNFSISHSAGMNASGTKSTSGDSYAFNENESSNHLFVLTKTMPGAMDGVGTVTSNVVSSMSGSTGGGALSSTQSVAIFQSRTEAGHVTYSGGTSPFASLSSHSAQDLINVSGPPATTGTATLLDTVSTSGADGGADMTEMGGAGQGITAGTQVSGQMGSSPRGSAEHLGTSPGSLDTSSGLLSGLGGEAAHPMSYSGAEIMPKPSPTGTSMWLQESN